MSTPSPSPDELAAPALRRALTMERARRRALEQEHARLRDALARQNARVEALAAENQALRARGQELVVEDDADTRDLLRAALAAEGIAVAAVATGGAARSWLGRRRPALLLLDELLPDGRGEDVARAARRRHGPALPILVVSAADHPWTGAMANVVALPKPFALGDLLRLVRTLRRPLPSRRPWAAVAG